MFECLVGRPPFEAKGVEETHQVRPSRVSRHLRSARARFLAALPPIAPRSRSQRIRDAEVVFPEEPALSAPARQLCASLLQKVPEERAKLEAVAEHEWCATSSV